MIKRRVLLAVIVDIEVEDEEHAKFVFDFARNNAKHDLREAASLALCEAEITDMNFCVAMDPFSLDSLP